MTDIDESYCHVNTEPNALRIIPHGTRCECRLLAEGLHQDPRTLSYEYCRNVLQKHWRMTCRHGEILPAAEHAPLIDKWRDTGDMTPLKAILVRNS